MRDKITSDSISNKQNALCIVRLIAKHCNSIICIESGSNSEVWIAESSIGKVVLRFIHLKNDKISRVLFDAGIRRVLYSQGLAVAKPIATSIDFPNIDFQVPWLIDEYVLGATPKRRQIPRSICLDLGELLWCLHNISVTGFGLPAYDSKEFQGTDDSPYDGLTKRFNDCWPLNNLDIKNHPLGKAAPQLVGALNLIKSEILDSLNESSSCVVHSDLHERQLLCKADHLVALIDFGDAMIADPAWDFASLYYFHGDQVLNNTLHSYGLNDSETVITRHRARLFSIIIACYHAQRSIVLEKPYRLNAAIVHLKNIL